ncbi:MAG: helix-turn-helix domain-containing protein [Defluviitaleaceae bacterium]|nr:helix-turn-helix domain-containing protein [Defluviitaleaceae bacterium]
MYTLELKSDNFKKSCKTVEPIIKRISMQDKLDLYDIRIAATAIGHTEDVSQSFIIGEKLLKELEKYSNHYRYHRIKMTIHSNITSRLARAKYYDNVLNHEELRKKFLIHIEKAIKLCRKEKFNDALSVNLVKKGLFFGDFDIVEKGLNIAEEYGNDTLYEMVVLMIEQYKSFHKFTMTTTELKAIVGKNIQAHRKANRIRSDEMAEMIGIGSISTLSHIERGFKQVGLSTLIKLSGIFKVSVDTLLRDSSKESPPTGVNVVKLNEINALIEEFEPEDLDDVAVVIRKLLHMSKKKKSNTEGDV